MTNEERPPMLGRRWRDECGDLWECTRMIATTEEVRFEFVRRSACRRFTIAAEPLAGWVEVTS